ncbi:MAG: helix-turn-helix domain-containing protein [Hydrococcus sp. RU_2_2]|nr:helix-turn-helix domain-containing protein [Hydrococcus sp. RU_2_2]NJP21856.1 helix-turn-helix domain-containing protein [Hydrococcus sp. CRU_1_1]
MAVLDRQRKIPIPTEADIELSTRSSRVLASLINSHNHTQKITVESENGQEESLLIPSVAYKLLIDILSQISQGNAVTLVPVQAELSTQQAANLLNVSRPYLIKLLEDREIPYRKIGKHRKILAKDLYEYKAEIDAKRSQSLDELTALSEELALYEDD